MFSYISDCVPSKLRSSPLRIGTLVFVFFVVAYLTLPYEAKAYLRREPSITACNIQEAEVSQCRDAHIESRIPSIVHFVYILKDPTKDFPFQFSQFLSIYSAWYRWRPETIYLHTNVSPESNPVTRAKNGDAGKWTKLAFTLPGLVVNTVSVPTYTDTGKEIASVEHQSDFVRVQAVHDFGGIYIDMDVYALRDVTTLYEMGFGAIGGRQVGGQLNSGTFMSEKGGKLISLWRHQMHQAYDGGWTTHSNAALTYAAEFLEDDTCEVLILGQDGFAPGGWTSPDVDRLFGTHPDSDTSHMVNIAQGGELPAFDEEPKGPQTSDHVPFWGRDWSCSYLLHAFAPNKPRHGVEHNQITPRSVLERRSDFALAVYPVAKHMYERNIISLDDTDTGF